jgi:hypothetical protein
LVLFFSPAAVATLEQTTIDAEQLGVFVDFAGGKQMFLIILVLKRAWRAFISSPQFFSTYKFESTIYLSKNVLTFSTFFTLFTFSSFSNFIIFRHFSLHMRPYWEIGAHCHRFTSAFLLIFNVGILLLLLTPTGINCLDNGLALTPPMGWMSWAKFFCETDCKKHPFSCINEQLYKVGKFGISKYEKINILFEGYGGPDCGGWLPGCRLSDNPH